MKTLYIVRHAKSSWKNPSLSDWERPLNNRGSRDAPFMGKRLAEHGINPEIMISSPAARALMTARVVAEQIGYAPSAIHTEKRLYAAGLGDALQVIKQLKDGLETVMIFGHNPAFTDLVDYITGDSIGNLPTCGICAVTFDLSSWQSVAPGTGTILFFDYPKKHLKK